jgi:hypothetical protein
MDYRKFLQEQKTSERIFVSEEEQGRSPGCPPMLGMRQCSTHPYYVYTYVGKPNTPFTELELDYVLYM